MNGDIKTIGGWVFAILALAWVATKAQPLGQFSQALAGSFSTAVGALKPSGA